MNNNDEHISQNQFFLRIFFMLALHTFAPYLIIIILEPDSTLVNLSYPIHAYILVLFDLQFFSIFSLQNISTSYIYSVRIG